MLRMLPVITHNKRKAKVVADQIKLSIRKSLRGASNKMYEYLIY